MKLAISFLFNQQLNKITFSSVFDSLGIVLTRGHGQYIFIGNVSVEEGKSYSSVSFFCICVYLSSFTLWFLFCFSSGLHDLLAPDLTIASEWWVELAEYTVGVFTSMLLFSRICVYFLMKYVLIGPTVRRTLTQRIVSWASCRRWCYTLRAKNQIWSVSPNLISSILSVHCGKIKHKAWLSMHHQTHHCIHISFVSDILTHELILKAQWQQQQLDVAKKMNLDLYKVCL